MTRHSLNHNDDEDGFIGSNAWYALGGILMVSIVFGGLYFVASANEHPKVDVADESLCGKKSYAIDVTYNKIRTIYMCGREDEVPYIVIK